MAPRRRLRRRRYRWRFGDIGRHLEKIALRLDFDAARLRQLIAEEMLSSLGFAATVLLGSLAGRVLRLKLPPRAKLLREPKPRKKRKSPARRSTRTLR